MRAPCMGRCDTAPVLEMGHNHIDHATPEKVRRPRLRQATRMRMFLTIEAFDAYRADGGYETLADIRAKGDFDKIQQTLLDAGLRGLGGAGFPSGRKWGFVARGARPALSGGKR